MAKDLSSFLEEVRFSVSDNDVGLRLDHFLVDKIFWRSRSDLQERIKQGKILLEGRRTKPAQKLKAGEEVVVIVTPADLPDQDPASIAVDVLYESKAAIVLNKQPGVLVHPTGRHVYDTLMNALHLRSKQAGSDDEAHVVHRLDRNTSGVLVVAKTQDAKKELQQTFQNLHPRKEYLALVEGVMLQDSGTVDAAIGPDDKAAIRLKMCVRQDGQPSLSHWQVEERFAAHTLVRVRIETGRQHQIRIHMMHLGHPVVCDPLYGDPRSVGLAGEDPLLEHQALHAELLEIHLPDETEAKTFRAPMHSSMQTVVDALRAGAALVHGRDVQSSRWSRA